MSEQSDPRPVIKALPGFTAVGTFKWTDGEYLLEASAGAIPRWHAIYALIQNGEVRYVGAAKDLRRRMQSYLRRQTKGSRRKRPVHGLLQQALGVGEISVFARAFDEIADFDGLPIDLVLGVEAGLIASLNPEWNRRGRNRLTIEVPAKTAPE